MDQDPSQDGQQAERQRGNICIQRALLIHTDYSGVNGM
jgi:hypothetical protein